MPLKITKAEVWSAEIPDRPGGLADVLDSLAGAGANLECLIARRQPGKQRTGRVFVTPLKGQRLQAAAASAGFHAKGRISTLRVEGPDKRGIGARIARAVGDAGVNMRGTSAAVIGRKFVCYLGFDSADDATKAAAAIRNSERARR
jgi:hypothetical protein